MDIVEVHYKIQFILVLIIIWSIMVCLIAGEHRVIKGVCIGLIIVSGGTLLIRFGSCITKEGYCYIHEVDDVSDFGRLQISSDDLELYGVTKEIRDNANPFDRVEISFKEDISGVSLLDVFLCKNEKWLEGGVVNSTDYVLLKGEDINLEVEKVEQPERYSMSYTRYYIDYKGCLYSIRLNENIDNSKDYVLL